MLLNFEEFSLSTDTVDAVLRSQNMNVQDIIQTAVDRCRPDAKNEFLSHMSTLFLDAILNRRELGGPAMNNASEARGIIDQMKRAYR